jgi:hypothetical protein
MYIALSRLLAALFTSIMLWPAQAMAADSGSCPLVRVASQPGLASAIVNRMPRIQVLAVGRPGSIARVVRRIGRLGGRALVRFDDVDYVRAEIPTLAYFDLCADPDVESLVPNDNEWQGAFRDPTPSRREDSADAFVAEVNKEKDAAARLPRLARPKLTAAMLAPEDNPYLPVQAVGGTRLKAFEPKADGRGVTIANMEGLFDPSRPMMQGALDLDGRAIGKIAGVIDPLATEDVVADDNAEVADAEAMDGSLVTPEATVDAASVGQLVNSKERSFRVPAAGQFFVGWYRVRKSARAVFWTSARSVWIDTNDDGDLSDERELREIGQTTDIHPAFTALRTTADDPNPPPGASTVFVQFDALNRPHVYNPHSAHATMGSSTAAGNGFVDHMGQSVAPAARLMLVNGGAEGGGGGASLGQRVESYVLTARDPRVDVMTSSFGVEATPDGSGESVLGVIIHRLTRKYGKTMLFAADNQGMLAHPSLLSSSPLTLTVGAADGADTIKAYYGRTVPDQIDLPNYSSGGPATNGAFKPDLVAPAMSLVAHGCGESPLETIVSLPDCYDVGGGTSNAAPFAAASAAALISAAKLNNLPHSASYISWAMRAGARPLPGHNVGAVGTGMVQVDRSFELLRNVPPLPSLTVMAPVERKAAAYLQTPSRGPGLMLYDGWYVGRSEIRLVDLAIAYARPARNYRLRWRDNDGAFSSNLIDRLKLRSGDHLKIPIRVAPLASGAHSAAIELFDVAAHVAVAEIAVSVVATPNFNLKNGYEFTQDISAGWPRSAFSFVSVGDSSALLQLDLASRSGRICHGAMLSPYADIDASPYTTWHFWNALNAGDIRSAAIENPATGTWQLKLDPCSQENWNGVRDEPENHVTMTATANWTFLKATVIAQQLRADSDGDVTANILFRNRGAVLRNPELTVSIGRRLINEAGNLSARGKGRTAEFDFTVDQVATSLYVNVDLDNGLGKPAPTPPFVDLYLYRCSPKKCLLADMRPGAGWQKTIRFADPSPGTWKALLVATKLPGRSMKYHFTSIMAAAEYGTANARLASDAPLSVGSSRRAIVNLYPLTPGKTSGDLFAFVDLVDGARVFSPEHSYLNLSKSNPSLPAPIATIIVPFR